MEVEDTTSKNIVIIGLLVAFVLLVFAFLKLATVSNLRTNKYGYDDVWDIAITNIRLVDKKGEAEEVSKPTFANKNASFDVRLKTPDSSLRYEISVKNRGTLDGKLQSYMLVPEDDKKNVEYIFDEPYVNDVLKSGLETKYYVTIKYLGEFNNDEASSRTLILEYVQNSRK